MGNKGVKELYIHDKLINWGFICNLRYLLVSLMIIDHMHINMLISCILCNHSYENDHKCMLSWSEMINFIFIKIFYFFIFYDILRELKQSKSLRKYFVNWKMIIYLKIKYNQF